MYLKMILSYDSINNMYTPPFDITNNILNLSLDISKQLGFLEGLQLDKPKVILRKENKIKTIQASLAIEGNTLTIDQVSDVLDGSIVKGPHKDILEVQNAINAYDIFNKLKYFSIQDFLKTHKVMMQNLISNPGKFREKNVGIFAGKEISHIAPQPRLVPELIKTLFEFLKRKDDISLLIKSCIFHYELEFIHPFTDGNGRMGRFWQHLILKNYNPLFEFVSIESLIKLKQKEYYKVLGECDTQGNSTKFIEFILNIILQTLNEYLSLAKYQPKSSHDRLEIAKNKLKDKFSRKDYCNIFKNLSTATASRDLQQGIKEGILKKTGDKSLTKYIFI